MNELKLEGFSDSDWGGNIDTRKSTSGYIFKLGNGVTSWSSKLQPTIALSTMEAEYMAATHSAKERIWIQQLLKQLNRNFNTISIQVDNQSSINLAKNPEYYGRSKHINIQHHFIQETIEEKKIKLEYCETSKMIADIMTKSLIKEKHKRFVKEMGMINKENIDN